MTRTRPGRIESLDIYRALAMLAVVGIHVLGHFLGEWRGTAWIIAALANRALQFAVPAFLTLSAFLNVRTAMRGGSLRVYAKKRILRAAWPYLVWTLIFAAFRSWEHSETLTAANLTTWLLTGKAYYHLYFLLLVLQLYVILPLLAVWFRYRPRIALVILVTVVLQGAIFFINRLTLWFTLPGSTILWYLPSVMLGCWLSPRRSLKQTVRSGTPAALVALALSAAVYLPLGLALLRGETGFAGRLQIALWIYVSAAAFLLLALSQRLARTFVSRALRPVGSRSLEIYILHPLVIWALDLSRPETMRAGAAAAVYFLMCVLVPLALARLLSVLRLSGLLFGTARSA